jgi:hypothetical protein
MSRRAIQPRTDIATGSHAQVAGDDAGFAPTLAAGR